jgi:hypothetical protein
MPRLTKQKMLDKQTRDMVDMALAWLVLSKDIKVDKKGEDAYRLFDAMQLEVLRTYTNIEEKISEKS